MTHDAHPAHTMHAPDGSLFFPDDEQEARWFLVEHGAVPMWPDAFPFDLVDPGDSASGVA